MPLRDPAAVASCRRLWAEVVLTAIEDAIRYGDYVEKTCGNSLGWSLSWFDSRDAREVCGYAGVDPQDAKRAAREWRQRFLDSGMKWPTFKKQHFYKLFHRDER